MCILKQTVLRFVLLDTHYTENMRTAAKQKSKWQSVVLCIVGGNVKMFIQFEGMWLDNHSWHNLSESGDSLTYRSCWQERSVPAPVICTKLLRINKSLYILNMIYRLHVHVKWMVLSPICAANIIDIQITSCNHSRHIQRHEKCGRRPGTDWSPFLNSTKTKTPGNTSEPDLFQSHLSCFCSME